MGKSKIKGKQEMPSHKNRKILIIDDDALFRDAICEYLGRQGIEMQSAGTASEGIKLCKRHKFDIILLDQKLPDGKGVSLCPTILSHNEQAKIIFVTAFPSFDNAVDAIKVGAHDYLSKPFEMKELDLIVSQAIRTLDLERVEQLQTYRNKRESKETVLIGNSTSISEIEHLIGLAAQNTAPVLITGETGTGKNLVAKAIHYRSPLQNSAYIGINCTTLPENLMEAELFGYEKGAFTGATAAKKGIFEMAEGGTLFLDEIGEMPLNLQTKLLGVLDDKTIKRLGGTFQRQVQTRIIAATNLDLESAIDDRRFRNDLYFRLSVLRIHLPCLRDHTGDIPELCTHFVSTIAPKLRLELSSIEIKALQSYHWPGNVRELRNILERSIILRQNDKLRPSQLLPDSGGGRLLENTTAPAPGRQTRANGKTEYVGEKLASLKETEKSHIAFVLERLSSNHTHAARALGISRSTLMRKIKTYGLE